jgi:hypothetical protein
VRKRGCDFDRGKMNRWRRIFIGRIERGFDFLGYHFSQARLTVAAKTLANFIEKASLLYEQKRGAVLAATALEMHVRRWVRWTRLGEMTRQCDAKMHPFAVFG